VSCKGWAPATAGARVAHHAAWKRYAITTKSGLSTRSKRQQRSEKAVNHHVHIQSPGHSGEGCPGLGSGLEEENKNRMRLLQQVMCQRHKHVAILR
jgi:hypothetical protein